MGGVHTRALELSSNRHNFMAGQVRPELFGNCDGADTGPTTAVGNAESLVQVQMQNIDSEFSRAHNADLCVHVGTIHIHKATRSMHFGGEGTDGFFIDAMSGRVGDHDAAQVIEVLLHTLAQVGEVNVTVV